MKISQINSFLLNYNFQGRKPISIPIDEFEDYVAKHPKFSLAQIANHFKVSRSALDRFVKTNDIKAFKPRKRGLPSSNIKKDDLAEYIRQNPKFTQEKIAQHYSTTASTIGKLIKNYNIEIYTNKSKNHPINLTKENLQTIIKQNPKFTEEQLADYFGVSISTISKYIDKYNIDYIRYKYPY